MGWRFRRSYRIIPGVRVNLSASGFSYTVGPRGASLNFGPRGTYANVGIPGTGLSHRTQIKNGTQNFTWGEGAQDHLATPEPRAGDSDSSFWVADSPTAVKSVGVDSVSSEGLAGFRGILTAILKEREQLESEIPAQKRAADELAGKLDGLRGSFLARNLQKTKITALDEQTNQAHARLHELEERLECCRFELHFECADAVTALYQQVVQAFGEAKTCAFIWDITSFETSDSRVSRSEAEAAVARKPIAFLHKALEFIDYAGLVPCLQNANGADLYLYPGFLLLLTGNQRLGLIDCAGLTVEFLVAGYQEEETVPKDAELDHYTWKKVNKDGSPDRRFAGNYRISVVKYGLLKLKSDTGLNEWFMLSDVNKARAFAEALQRYAALFQPKPEA